MADAVTTNVIFKNTNFIVTQFTNISDGTGEAAVKKIDITTLRNTFGVVPTKLKLVDLHSLIQGFTGVRLLFDHTADDIAALLTPGAVRRDYRGVGGLVDPASAGGDGSILLTTMGAASGATYDIIALWEMH